jgi:hypothetical protein
MDRMRRGMERRRGAGEVMGTPSRRDKRWWLGETEQRDGTGRTMKLFVYILQAA